MYFAQSAQRLDEGITLKSQRLPRYPQTNAEIIIICLEPQSLGDPAKQKTPCLLLCELARVVCPSLTIL